MLIKETELRKLILNLLLENTDDDDNEKEEEEPLGAFHDPDIDDEEAKIRQWRPDDAEKEVLRDATNKAQNSAIGYILGSKYKKYLDNIKEKFKNNKAISALLEGNFVDDIVDLMGRAKFGFHHRHQYKDLNGETLGWMTLGDMSTMTGKPSLNADIATYREKVNETPEIVIIYSADPPYSIAKLSLDNRGKNTDYLSEIAKLVEDTVFHELMHIEGILSDLVFIRETGKRTYQDEITKYLISTSDLINSEVKQKQMGDRAEFRGAILTLRDYISPKTSKAGSIETRQRIQALKNRGQFLDGMRDAKNPETTYKELESKYGPDVAQLLFLLDYDNHSIEDIARGLEGLASNITPAGDTAIT